MSALNPAGCSESTGTVHAAQQREKMLAELFPSGIPRLWCPTLTHFRSQGELDDERLRRHLDHIAPYTQGILVPGSTGEGWEMDGAEIRRLLAIVLDAAQLAGLHVLIGVLKHSVAEVLCCLEETVSWLKSRTGAATAKQAMSGSGVVGFTVCPPRGADLSQDIIRDSLGEILACGLPTALYQLPQVTGNEMTPQTVRLLADRYPNLLLFKDSSGRDVVARAGMDLGGVFLVRGAEGQYARSTRAGDGPYDGLLLSTANVFASALHEILRLLEDGRKDQAATFAGRIEPVVEQTFAMVAEFKAGNPFTNANKILDHVMAFGPSATQHAPPLLYRGARLPAEYVEKAVEFLGRADLLPPRGYLAAQ